jgi:predicted nucleotidyltransferase
MNRLIDLEHYPIEGDILQTQSGCFFDVIGFDHPNNRIIAYPRYVPTNQETDRILYPNQNIAYFAQQIPSQTKKTLVYFQKLVDFAAKTQFLSEKMPHFIYSPSNYDMDFHTVPISEIKYHYRPEDRNLWNQRSADELSQISQDFVDLLVKQAGISPDHIGITGSQLIQLTNAQSDIDIIIYGFLNSLKVRNVIRDYFNESNQNRLIRQYTLAEFKELYSKRVDASGVRYFDFLKYELRKLHQGKYSGRDFFIRFLEHPQRQTYRQENQFDSQQIRNLGRIKINGEVRGDEHWWTTPAWVEIINLQIENISELQTNYKALLEQYNLELDRIWRTYTYRGRFIENIRLLEQFSAYGNLELVIPPHDTPFLQISFGSDARDYLKVK